MLYTLVGVVLATLFAGAALYISLVEQPARMQLDDTASLAQWQPSYKRALPIQAGLTVLGGLVGLFAYYLFGDWQLLVGSLFLLANWPFTLLVIMPTNRRLQAIKPQDAGPASRDLLIRWAALHHVRAALGSTAVLLFCWGLLVIAPTR